MVAKHNQTIDDMASITIKDIPPRLHRALKKRALANHRSLQKEIIACLEDAVSNRAMTTKEFLDGAARLRARFRDPVGPEIIDDAKRRGRS